MEKNNPFKVPDNYFQAVKLEIIKNLPEKQKKLEKRNVFFANVILKWSAFAAIVILLIFVGFEYIGDHNKYLVSKTKQVQEEKSPSTVDKQYASLQDDYYLFLEDQTAISIYREVLDSDDLLN